MVLLAACGTQSPEPGGITMDCAIGAGSDFDPVCSVYEVKAVDEDAYLVMWHPDGGFRRVRYRNADQTVEVLDGAAAATDVTHLEDGSVQFAIDGDRYRLPAQIVSLNEAVGAGAP
jgi:hypothetical protein